MNKKEGSTRKGKKRDSSIPHVIKPILDHEVSQAENELKQGYREISVDNFKGHDEVAIHIVHPTVGIDGQATDAYAEAYSQLISNPNCKLLTKEQMLKVLKEKNIWTDKDDQEIEQFREGIKTIIFKVAEMRSQKKFNETTFEHLKKEFYKLRDKLSGKIAAQNEYLGNTIEGRAEEAQLKVKLVNCVKFSDDKPVWNTVEELNSEKEKVPTLDIIYEATLFWSGLSSEILSELPDKILEFFRGETVNLGKLPELIGGKTDTPSQKK